MGINSFPSALHISILRILVGGIVIVLFILIQPSAAHAEYGDVVLNKRAQAAGMRPVIFPHWFHRIRFRCKVCHYVDPLSQNDAGFEMRAGSNDIMMLDIIEGRFCGMCHNNKIAWGPENCNLCHSGIPGLPSGVRGGEKTRGPGKW
jgi:c(7)-type cytochrome triheme protein